jgi:hypothetical protein
MDLEQIYDGVNRVLQKGVRSYFKCTQGIPSDTLLHPL